MASSSGSLAGSVAVIDPPSDTPFNRRLADVVVIVSKPAAGCTALRRRLTCRCAASHVSENSVPYRASESVPSRCQRQVPGERRASRQSAGGGGSGGAGFGRTMMTGGGAGAGLGAAAHPARTCVSVSVKSNRGTFAFIAPVWDGLATSSSPASL